uniref:Actin-related protein 3 n=1 Tax=Euplotes harpa TaxID=151035 RepID=A0A7S3JGF0_9SPIT|mmetsp:Transcript_36063/g.41644  ORF Transcript_36063/g.41644 Transcript_36063/m.41644 type:complete len:422 (+) Transcript_36063:24-1289(+)
MDTSAIVIDNGTGFTKMGFAGNLDPSFIIPSVIGEYPEKSDVSVSKNQFNDYDYYIGEEAFLNTKSHGLCYLMKGGMIENWEQMEKFWHKSIFQYLRADPEEHYMVLTEPPMNTPENREQMAEIMFETFGVPGLFIGIQAILALYAGKYASLGDSSKISGNDLTGTVIDSGDGVTHVIPIVYGYPISNNIKHIPIAGRDITKFVQQALIDRKEPIPANERQEISRIIKENYCYCAPDIVKEHKKYDEKVKDPETGKWKQSKKFKKVSLTSPYSGKRIKCDLGYEAFMAPEIFFHPEFVNSDYRESLDQIVDVAILKSPLDNRTDLYKNIVLSGGSTLFKNFDKRLEQEVRRRVKERYEGMGILENAPEVKVSQNLIQNAAVWFGGSMLASNKSHFVNIVATKEQYEEYGPAIARHNAVFKL